MPALDVFSLDGRAALVTGAGGGIGAAVARAFAAAGAAVIALGHPVGATGGRLPATIVAEMERRDVELGLVTMCCGGGLGTGTLLQRV